MVWRAHSQWHAHLRLSIAPIGRGYLRRRTPFAVTARPGAEGGNIITPCDRVNYNGVSRSRTAPRGPWSRDVVDLTCPVVVGKVGWRNCLAAARGLGAKTTHQNCKRGAPGSIRVARPSPRLGISCWSGQKLSKVQMRSWCGCRRSRVKVKKFSYEVDYPVCFSPFFPPVLRGNLKLDNLDPRYLKGPPPTQAFMPTLVGSPRYAVIAGDPE